jgi:hypothetical protein
MRFSCVFTPAGEVNTQEKVEAGGRRVARGLVLAPGELGGAQAARS